MSTVSPLDALRHAQRPGPKTAAGPRLLLAGATGALGNEVLSRVVGAQNYALVQVLAREPYVQGLRGMELLAQQDDDVRQWPVQHADVGLIMFEPPRLHYQRERALWTPRPDQLQAVAQWMHCGGGQTLAVVLPHDAGRLPQALKRGLANLNEQGVAALGFERLIFVRSAREAQKAGAGHWLQRTANTMLSAFSHMLAQTERPVRAMHVARLVEAALLKAPPGIHVAPPELVWRAAQKEGLQPELQSWLGSS
ncbi:MAG: hypothetical protein LBV05_12405 [Comamonas sp.]|jgi:hypothetical protein|uniref:hypothetical protein n=1 Tax=Comamonas sp. TaxID=34028 RepID=UPI00284AB94D|nr:hypothetical protein [Comamonas sp.]MDR3066293.1 hypothetical protein [Comamonas sp.]